LGATKATGRAIEAFAELAEIVWCAVGEIIVGLRPHVLGGIELRCVRGEVVDSEPRMGGPGTRGLRAGDGSAPTWRDYGQIPIAPGKSRRLRGIG
jgi:hypothetical protein